MSEKDKEKIEVVQVEERQTASVSIDDVLDEMQRRYIQQVLEKTSGKIGGSGGAAEILGMKPSTLYDRMKKLGIERPKI